jgi:polygalacturonase
MFHPIRLLALSAAPAIAIASLAATPTGAGLGPEAGDVSPAQPVIPARTFKLNDFGAVADASTLNTDAFRRAIAAVDQAGGGTLIVPAGIYLTGPIDLCSGINLHLDPGSTILFSPELMPSEDGKMRPLLLAKDAHDIMVSGRGTINGSGEAWWPATRASKRNHTPEKPRPRFVVFDGCRRVRVEGITLTHSPEFNLVPTHCQDVTIDGIAIYNPADDNAKDDGLDPPQVRAHLLQEYADDAPNTDGIDPMVSQRVLIAHCRIDTGDDCIAIKANAGGVSEDILVTDCTFLHGHGCSVGSGTQGGLRHLTVRRCTFDGTKVGVHLKSARDRGGLVENVTFADLTMRNVGEAILITSYYDAIDIHIYYRPYLKKFSIDLANGRHDEPQPITATTPRWRDVTIRNVTATCIWEAGMILGLPEMPAEKIVLDHVTIEAPEGLRVSYARDVKLRDVQIRSERGPPLIVSDTVEGLAR